MEVNQQETINASKELNKQQVSARCPPNTSPPQGGKKENSSVLMSYKPRWHNPFSSSACRHTPAQSSPRGHIGANTSEAKVHPHPDSWVEPSRMISHDIMHSNCIPRIPRLTKIHQN